VIPEHATTTLINSPRTNNELSIVRMKRMTVTREALYEEVWADPMIVVATRYEVSANFLARVCHTPNVPHPPRGYWAKLKVGAAPPKPGLPAAGGGIQRSGRRE
jgi:hypothetical protein